MLKHPQWLLFPNAISKEECDAWVALGRTIDAQDATTFGGHGDSIRKTLVRWLPDTPPFDTIHAKLREIVHEANEQFNVDLTHLPPLQFTEYADVGHHYGAHQDIDWARQDGFHRKLSITVQLSDSDDYTGGDFAFGHHENPSAEMSRQQGTILVFLSYQEHSVSPILSGSRTSIVGWYEGPRWR